ncbi:MAG: hypothetical protein WD009_12540 [Phycisphaeraceae bacterium]
MTRTPLPPLEPQPAAAPAPPRRAPLTREQVARIELGRTAIRRPVAWLLIAMFLVTIAGPGAWEHAHALRTWLDGRASDEPMAWREVRPPVHAITDLLPAARDMAAARSFADALALLPSEQAIDAFETDVEERARTHAVVLPHVQWALTTLGRTGNEQAWVGRDGWLFYQPDVEYVTGPPFLDERRLAEIARFSDRQPDPLAAIVDLRDQLAERNIALVVMPTPVKPQVHPEKLTARYAADAAPLNNAAYASFIAALDEARVPVFDPLPLLHERQRATGRAQYLVSDTHWTPETVEAVAAALATRLRDDALVPMPTRTPFTREQASVAQHGDVTVMLKLPPWQQRYREQTVRIHRVLADAAPWQPQRGSPVLLLGDSFTNIYAMAELGWGEHAGLAEQLAYHLQSPVDRLARNAGGAHAARQQLAQALRRGEDRLEGVEVVVWQFATRELLTGDWRLIDLPTPAAPTTDARDADAIVVRATVADIARPPRPGTVAYADAVVSVHLTDVEPVAGELADEELLVYVLGMRDNQWTAPAAWRPGDRVEVTLQSWDDVADEYGRLQHMMLGDIEFELAPWWAEP